MTVGRRIKGGLLIAIEGIDGAGKTTQAERLDKLISDQGFEVVRRKEPTDGRWGRQLRESAQTGRLSPADELDLFIRDRREHVETVIHPALAEGKVVIVDRYYFSTVAYQGARGMDVEKLLDQNEEFAPKPHLLVLIDVEPKLGIERIRARGDKENHFEQEASLEAVARIFRMMQFPYLRRVDGRNSVDNIALSIMEVLNSGPLSSARDPDQPVSRNPEDWITNGELWSAIRG